MHSAPDHTLKEACGVVGIIADDNVVPDVITAMTVLQHRGQESAGIAYPDKNKRNRISRKIGMGLVHEVFSGGVSEDTESDVCIGHVRYSTTGRSLRENSQPFVVGTAKADLAIAHNGDIVNANHFRDNVLERNSILVTDTDSELMIRHLAKKISSGVDVDKAIDSLCEKLVGSYSCVFLMGDKLYAFRDNYGFRPLVIGKMPGGGYVVASETVAIDSIGGEFIRDVKPGEIVEVSKKKVKTLNIRRPNKHTGMCMFEWVYFSRPDSKNDGKMVYDVRKRIGLTLAKEHPVEADYVIPVPDSGRAHALGYCEGSGIPYAEGLMKNRYIDRSFILPSQEQRKEAVRLKLNPIESVVKGKRVILVDDSIVRGTTMRTIVSILKKGGAKEVHLRIGCMPIRAPCYFGIDMKSRDQFIATGRTPEEIGEVLGCDSLGYISKSGLVEAIGFPAEDLCLGCLTGEYPVAVEGEKSRHQKDLDSFM